MSCKWWTKKQERCCRKVDSRNPCSGMCPAHAEYKKSKDIFVNFAFPSFVKSTKERLIFFYRERLFPRSEYSFLCGTSDEFAMWFLGAARERFGVLPQTNNIKKIAYEQVYNTRTNDEQRSYQDLREIPRGEELCSVRNSDFMVELSSNPTLSARFFYLPLDWSRVSKNPAIDIYTLWKHKCLDVHAFCYHPCLTIDFLRENKKVEGSLELKLILLQAILI